MGQCLCVLILSWLYIHVMSYHGLRSQNAHYMFFSPAHMAHMVKIKASHLARSFQAPRNPTEPNHPAS